TFCTLVCLLLLSLVAPAEAYDAGDALALLLGTVLTVVGCCACLGWYARKERETLLTVPSCCHPHRIIITCRMTLILCTLAAQGLCRGGRQETCLTKGEGRRGG
uniref:Si:dkey-112e7.2 n=1 Tax=Sparus aurata TaxID=8175 RepID=A0A671Y996_SPAAU